MTGAVATVENAHGQSDMALGRHALVECYGCNRAILNDCNAVREALLHAARESGATVIGDQFHEFAPQGISGFVVISESHFSIHTWPEHDYAAVDIFTCGGDIDFDIATKLVSSGLGSSAPVISAMFPRGFPDQGARRSGPSATRVQPRDAFAAPRLHPSDFSMTWGDHYLAAHAWGISLSVDLHDCARRVGGDDDVLGGDLVAGLVRVAEAERAAPEVVGDAVVEKAPQLRPRMLRGHEMCLELVAPCGPLQTLTLSQRAAGSQHCDMLFAQFVEPRLVAEFLTEFCKADTYRLQVAVRT